MSDISKIKVSGVEYDIKDIQARENLGNLGTRVTELEQHGGGVQPDWNQNDATQSDYVKNRPFYTGDTVETVLLEETTAEFTRVEDGVYSHTLTNPFSLEFAQTFQVSWDGTTYECVSAEFMGEKVFGNLSIYVEGPDTGEPFLYGFGAFYTSDASPAHVISVNATIQQFTKIDKKYLPEDYLSKKNPTGIGSFSLNREADTEIGDYSFASGYSATASGDTSHAEGGFTTASGGRSHAECSNTVASGLASHAEGYGSEAGGENSHAEGKHTKASGYASHVQGTYNIEDGSSLYAHIVGNGTSDSARSNAHTLDWSGNAWFAGTVEGTALILPSSTAGSTKKFKITVDDSGTLSATEVTA